MDSVQMLSKQRKWIFPFFIGIGIGLTIFILFLPYYKEIYTDNDFKRLLNVEMNRLAFFFYVLKRRLLVFTGLFLISRIHRLHGLLSVFVIYLGVCMGIGITAFSMKFGIWGAPFFLMALFPHFIFYFISFLLLMQNEQNDNRNILLSGVVVIIGCFMESYVNTFLFITIISLV